MQVEYVKIGDLRQITPYNLKMIQDRHIVSMEIEVTFDVSNGYGLGDPIAQGLITAFFVAFCIFVVDEHRDFNFGTQVYCR